MTTPSQAALTALINERIAAVHALLPTSTTGGQTPLPAEKLAAYIDHTLLKPDAQADQIRQLCAQAREYGFATVCVNPTWVSLCAELLATDRTH